MNPPIIIGINTVGTHPVTVTGRAIGKSYGLALSEPRGLSCGIGILRCAQNDKVLERR